MAFTPAAMALVASSFWTLTCAKWAATRDDEHAVSVPTHGPVNPKVNDTLENANPHQYQDSLLFSRFLRTGHTRSVSKRKRKDC